MNDTPLFILGQVVWTPGAGEAMAKAGHSLCDLLYRHLHGDWGNVDKHDAQLNDEAVRDGGRIFSAYALADGVKVWVITEADRSSTCILLPDEY